MNNDEKLLDSYRVIFNVITLKAKNLHAALCKETGRIVCFTNWMQTAKALESDTSLQIWYFIKGTKLIPNNINLNIPFELTFDRIAGSFFLKELTEEEVRKYLITSEKSAVLDIMHRTINQERDYIRPNLSLQQNIYDRKYKEALEVLTTEFNRDKHPYIDYESELFNIRPLELAKKILIKHEVNESKILQTEMIRIKYTKLLKECNDLITINKILDEFNRESSIYGRF